MRKALLIAGLVLAAGREARAVQGVGSGYGTCGCGDHSGTEAQCIQYMCGGAHGNKYAGLCGGRGGGGGGAPAGITAQQAVGLQMFGMGMQMMMDGLNQAGENAKRRQAAEEARQAMERQQALEREAQRRAHFDAKHAELMRQMGGTTGGGLKLKSAFEDDGPRQDLIDRKCQFGLAERRNILQNMGDRKDKDWCKLNFHHLMCPARTSGALNDDFAKNAWAQNKRWTREWDKRCGGPSAQPGYEDSNGAETPETAKAPPAQPGKLQLKSVDEPASPPAKDPTLTPEHLNPNPALMKEVGDLKAARGAEPGGSRPDAVAEPKKALEGVEEKDAGEARKGFDNAGPVRDQAKPDVAKADPTAPAKPSPAAEKASSANPAPTNVRSPETGKPAGPDPTMKRQVTERYDVMQKRADAREAEIRYQARKDRDAITYSDLSPGEKELRMRAVDQRAEADIKKAREGLERQFLRESGVPMAELAGKGLESRSDYLAGVKSHVPLNTERLQVEQRLTVLDKQIAAREAEVYQKARKELDDIDGDKALSKDEKIRRRGEVMNRTVSDVQKARQELTNRMWAELRTN